MAKISLTKLKLNKNSSINTISINEQEVEVLKYLPIEDKIDLIEAVMQESDLNPVLLDVLLHYYIVIMYTNIGLTPSQRENIFETYDLLEKNGVIDEVVSAIPDSEYTNLVSGLTECVERQDKVNNSILSIVKMALEKLEDSFGETFDNLSKVDLSSESLKTVLAIAKDNGAI